MVGLVNGFVMESMAVSKINLVNTEQNETKMMLHKPMFEPT